MSRHCRNCGKLMQLHRATFSRPGGYRCINHHCVESPIFRYQTIKGDLMMGNIKARRLKGAIA